MSKALPLKELDMSTNNATLDADLTVNPSKARKLVLETTVIDHLAKAITINVTLTDVNGVTVDARTLTIKTAAVATWIGNQETTILNALLAKLGVTGVIG